MQIYKKNENEQKNVQVLVVTKVFFLFFQGIYIYY